MTADTLIARYVPTLIQYEDRIEYVTVDAPTFVWSISPEFGILLHVQTRLPVGFCLAGKHVAGPELLALGEAAVNESNTYYDVDTSDYAVSYARRRLQVAARAYAASVASIPST